MQYVKIIFRDAKRMETIHLSLDKWESILDDPKTLVKFMLDSEKEWTGRILNKAEVISAEPDAEFTKKKNEASYSLFRNKLTNVVVKLPVNTIIAADKVDEYEKIK